MNVNQFGKLFTYPVDGSIYAQPLYVPNVTIAGKGTHNVVYVATMNDVVYAFDADSNEGTNVFPLWSVDFRNLAAGVTAVPIADILSPNTGITDILGNVGVESTPYIDTSSQTMYLVARTWENGNFVQRLHALDITSGAEKFGGPVSISAAVSGTGAGSAGGTITFDPMIQNQRPAIAYANGMIFIAWGSHGDQFDYHGWVMAYDAKTLNQVGVTCITPNGTEGGVWMSGRGPVVDASGNVYYMSGNGDWDGTSNFGDSFLKYATTTDAFSLSDWFTPDDWLTLANQDEDVGSGGPLLIPGTNLLVGGGKESLLYVMNVNNMGHEWAGNGQIVQEFNAGGSSIYTSPVYYNRSADPGPWMYLWASEDYLKAYHFNGLTFDSTPISQSTFSGPQGAYGGALAVTANGSAPGTGIVWAAMASSPNNESGIMSGVIRAFDASDLTNELWDSLQNQGRDDIVTWGKFRPPLVVNGKLYAGSSSNFLAVYGLLPTSPDFAVVAGSSTSALSLGGTASYTININAFAGFTGNVNLSVSGLPPGASASFSPASVAGSGSSILTVTAAAGGSQANWVLTITAASDALTHTTEVILVPQIVSASFVSTDTATQGQWQASYGADGYALANVTPQQIPNYAQFQVELESTATWATNPGDLSALQVPGGGGTIEAAWYSPAPFSFDVNFTDGAAHQFALYAADWDKQQRTETIQILDANTNNVLDTRTISYFTGGIYLVWNVFGHVIVTVTPNAGPSAVVSGVFFGNVNPATQVTITSGNSATFVVGQPGTFTLTTLGAPVPSITESGTLPPGVSFVDNGNGTGTLSGAPVSGTGQPYNISFTAANNISSVTQNFTLNVPGYITSYILGTQRNDFTGWVGMRITVGASPVNVTALGRIVAPGNTGSHTVKIVNASNSQDISGGSASVSTASGTTGSFAYANLPEPVTLEANTVYYIVSQETAGGDAWYDVDTTLQTTSVASEVGGVYSSGDATYGVYGPANVAYVPVDFLYSSGVIKPVVTQQPQNESVAEGTGATFSVNAAGGNLSYQWESAPAGSSSFSPIGGATGSSYSTPPTTLGQSGTQYLCVVSNTAGSTSSNAATLTVVASLSTTNYLTSFTLGARRNNFTGWVGMRITVGGSPVTVASLGRIVAAGDTGSHTVKIVDGSSGQDLTGGSVSVSMSGGKAGSLAYALLAAPVTLNANTTYYIVSQENSGGDAWYDVNTAIQTASVAAETTGVYSYDGATYNFYGSANQSYGPVDFLYAIILTQPVVTQQPQNQTVGVGTAATFSVSATGGDLSYQWESAPAGSSTFSPISGATESSYSTPATTLDQSGTQYLCVVSNTAGSISSNAATMTVVAAPPSSHYITSASLGTGRNDFSGWVGMKITVGGSPVTVTSLGRIVAPGDTGSHRLKIVSASNSQDVSGGSVSVAMSGGTAGSFAYALLPSPVTLNANTAYYVVSQETSGGDAWYDVNTTIQTASVAAETAGVYSYDGAAYNLYGSANQSYGPVDFLYAIILTQPVVTQQPQNQTVGVGTAATFTVSATGGDLSYQWESAPAGSSTFSPIGGATESSYSTPATTLDQSGTQYMCVVSNTAGSISSNAATMTVVATPPSTHFVTSTSLGTPRNNFSGWVGMKITVGGSPVTVSSLGRIVAPGNAGSHAVKIVSASNSQDVSGGSISVSTSGGTVGSFAYALLPAPVTLNANTAYYVVSQETSGGDAWYDVNTTIQTASIASETTGVYSYDGASYNFYGSANQSYGPVDFLYTIILTQPVVTQQPQNQTVGVGTAATFTVSATGGDLSYQWESAPAGSSTFSPIGGATGSSYSTPATTLDQSGTQYMCVVSNTAGSISSNAATMTVLASLPTASYVTSFSLGTGRNNFTGWVGMSIAVGSSPVTVTSLGRIVAPGDTGSHTVKIVSASNSQDISGGSVSLPTSGGTVGSFAYALLPAPVTLNANTTYYIVSQETNGGDAWYDINTTIQTAGIAGETTGVYSYDGATYYLFGSANHSYGPVGFLYSVN